MKRGFTLIELLAVIVILAIISLIAVPIVINIINDSKTASQEESIKMYAKIVEKAATNYFLKHPREKTVTIDKLEKLINYSGDRVICKTTKIYSNGKIYLGKCSVGGISIKYEYGQRPLCVLEDDNNEDNKISIGDKYLCNVNPNKVFTFYVLSFNSNDKVNLIMDRNIQYNGNVVTFEQNGRYPWNSSGNSDNRIGPNQAMNFIYNATKDWTNVPDMIMNYSDEGNNYDKIVTHSNKIEIINRNSNGSRNFINYDEGNPLKARIPMLVEVASEETNCSILNFDSGNGTCASWLVDHLQESSNQIAKQTYQSNEKIDNQLGYWLLSTNSNNTSETMYVNYNGLVASVSSYYSGRCGIRPVINVSIDDLSN